MVIGGDVEKSYGLHFASTFYLQYLVNKFFALIQVI
jgi:hypothetical protein